MEKWYVFFERWINGWWLLLLLLAWSPFVLYFLPESAEKLNLFAGQEVSILDVQFGFSPEEAHDLLEQMGASGRAYYRQTIWTLDLGFPIANALLFTSTLIWLFRRVFNPGSTWRYFSLLPLLAFVFDLLENTGITLLVDRFPDLPVALVHLTATAGAIKFFLSGLSLFLILAAAVSWGVSRKR